MSEEAYKGEHLPPETTKRPPAKKDTRRWCKGKVGREHVRTVEKRPLYARDRACQWYPWWLRGLQQSASWRWSCYHAVVCAECGKVLVDGLGEDCPDLVPEPTEVRYHRGRTS